MLYECTAANTWSVYYTPYAYPHPLVTGDPPPVLPGVLTNFHMATFRGDTFAIPVWTRSTDAGHVAYNLYRCVTVEPCDGLIARITPASAAAARQPETQWIDTTLNTGGTYYYRVADENSAGIGTTTAPIAVTVNGR